MLEMGLVVAIGLIAIFWKLSWRARIRLLSFPLALDISVFAFLNALHWGTFSGIMVAAVGAVFCSICINIGRWLFGYFKKGVYVPGKLDISNKL